MSSSTRGKSTPKDPGREDRLKAALKANMARRKAQAKARGTGTKPQQADRKE